MRYFNFQNIRLVVIFLILIGLFSFTSFRNSQRKIKKIEVEIIDNNMPFLKPEMVNKLLIEKNQDAKTIHKDDLDLNKLEKSVSKQQFVEKADVFVTVDGVLKAVVKQKSPVGRVVAEDSSFYIDSEGNRMPVSENFAARVPLISGGIFNVEKEKFAEVLQKISDDDFLKKNIISVQILPNGSLVMENRNYDFKIDFGRTINIDKKFKNYKAFFQKAVNDSLLKNYKRINLKFTQQVVCIK